METFSALLAIYADNSPVTGWRFESPSGPLWRQCNGKDNKYAHSLHFVTFYCVFAHPAGSLEGSVTIASLATVHNITVTS